MIIRLTILSLIIIILPACSLFSNALTMEQCLTLDTYQTGLQDGQAGQATSITTIVQQCHVHDVSVDTDSYHLGYEQGLKIYCVPRTAFNLAKQGSPFPSFCSRVVDVSTLENEYNRGADIYAQISALNSQINEIDTQLNETNNLNNQITDLERQLFDLQEEIDVYGESSYIVREKVLQARSIQREIQTLRLQMRQSAIANSPAVQNELLRQRENLVAQISQLQAMS